MEPESHRLDREAMIADHLAIAARLRCEVDEAVAAATEKRRAYFEQFLDRLRAASQGQLPAERSPRLQETKEPQVR